MIKGALHTMKHMTALDAKVWRPINRPRFGVVDAISERIRTEEWRTPGLLTTTNRGPTLLVASDYGGEHRKSGFHSFSFLLADLAYLWYWDEKRTELRRHRLRQGRRLSYKKLQSDSDRARALVPFLRASNTIPGLLITFLISKKIDTLFSSSLEQPDVPPVVERSHWRSRPFEKLLRVAHLGSLVVSGMLGDGQNLLWVTDRDEIVPNDDRHVEACKLIGHVLGHYLNCNIGRLQLATTRSDDGGHGLEDFASLPDFAAGALAEVVTAMSASGSLSGNDILAPLARDIPEKAHALTVWLADNSFTLKKLAFVIDHVPPDGIKSKLLVLRVNGPTREYNPFPELARRVGDDA